MKRARRPPSWRRGERGYLGTVNRHGDGGSRPGGYADARDTSFVGAYIESESTPLSVKCEVCVCVCVGVCVCVT